MDEVFEKEIMNLYEALGQLNLEEQEHYHMGMMNLPEDIEDHIDEEDKAKYQSLQKAMMVQIKFDDKSTHLTPAIKFYGHWRSVGPDDLTDQDYLNIEALDKNLLPLTVRARIADVLWIQKKDYRSAIEAISTYRLLFEKWFSVEKWVQAVPIIKRAIIISRQLHNNA